MDNKAIKSGRHAKSEKTPFTGVFRELVGTATHQEIADKIGTSRQNVGKWLSGTTSPDITALGKIADAYNVSTDYLLGRTNVKSTNTEIKDICEYVNLSEDTVNALHKFNPVEEYYSPDVDKNSSSDIGFKFLNNLIKNIIDSHIIGYFVQYIHDDIYIYEFEKCVAQKYCSENNIKFDEKETDRFDLIDLISEKDSYKFEFYKSELLSKYGMILNRGEALLNEKEYIKYKVTKKFNDLIELVLDDVKSECFDCAFCSQLEKNFDEYFTDILSLSDEDFSAFAKAIIDRKLVLEKMMKKAKEGDPNAQHNQKQE